MVKVEVKWHVKYIQCDEFAEWANVPDRLDSIHNTQVDGRHQGEDDAASDCIFDKVLSHREVLRVKLEEHVLSLPKQVIQDLISLFVQRLFFELAEHVLYFILLSFIELLLLALFSFSHQFDHVPLKPFLLGGSEWIIFSHY